MGKGEGGEGREGRGGREGGGRVGKGEGGEGEEGGREGGEGGWGGREEREGMGLAISPLVWITGTPDAQMNPKKKIFETVQPQLRTNEEGVACYKDAPFTVTGKGVCRSQTMKGTGIK